MARLNLTSLFIFCIAAFSLISCQKDIKNLKDAVTVHGASAKDGPVPSYPFNWETATYMPSSPANQVPMPWNSGTTAIDPNIVSDYASADGWVMVWNSFSPTQPIANAQTTLFFALYNVYRGVLRFYLWQPPTPLATTFVSHGLKWYTNTPTSMLNFNAQDIITAPQNQSSFAALTNQQINLNGGTWYAFQYEIAYDNNIGNTYFPDPSVPSGASTQALEWKSQWVNVTTAKFNGSLLGTITGTLEQPQTLGSTLINLGGNAIAGSLEIWGLNNIPSGANADSYKNALQNALGNTVTNFFNGIIGSINGSSATNVDLTINAQINLSGTLVDNGGLEDMKLVLPGQVNSQTANGLTPNYNNVLGLFNISSTPQIRIDESDSWSYRTVEPYDGVTPCTESGVNAKCWFDASSVNIVWNNQVVNSSSSGVSIQNLHTDVVALYTQPGGEQVGSWSASSFRDPTAASPALISYNTQTCASSGVIPYTPLLAVRVSFEVVPNNGGKHAKISKTFWSNQF